MTFFEILSTLMVSKNVTKKQLSEELPIGKNQLKYWEVNGNIPNGETLIALSDYFDCSVDYLLGRTRQKNNAAVPIAKSSSEEDANKQKLINNYDLLNDEGQQDLVEYSDMLAGNPRKIKESYKAVPIDA